MCVLSMTGYLQKDVVKCGNIYNSKHLDVSSPFNIISQFYVKLLYIDIIIAVLCKLSQVISKAIGNVVIVNYLISK